MPKAPPPRPETPDPRPLGSPLEAFEYLLGLLTPIDLSASNGAHGGSKKGDTPQIECLPCEDYETMIRAWQKALKWTEGLDHALSVMLACAASTRAVGDQLWIKVIGPASCGKSTLCEALNLAQKYIISKDTFTGLSSGYQINDDGGENLSLVTKIRDKTLIINDGDTLLQLSNLPQVISQLRAFYGRNLRTAYKNLMSADHEGYNTTIILCGTSSLRKLDESELGERFLDCVLMETIDDDLEDEILLRVADRADDNLSMEADGEATKQYDPDLVSAMQLTGGYVEHLRDNTVDALSVIVSSKEVKRRCANLGKFVAFMRARPSFRQEETAEREFAARLVSQLIRLAKCLALVFNRKEVDGHVMIRVKKVAMDTGRGVTMDLVHHLHDNPQGSGVRSVAVTNGLTSDKAGRLLRFLRQIHAVEQFEAKKVKGIVMSGGTKWRLTERMRKLYEEVMCHD